jgi:hypothetical protein
MQEKGKGVLSGPLGNEAGMQITFRLAMDDIVSFNTYVFATSPAIRRSFLINKLIISGTPLAVVLAQVYILRMPFRESLLFIVPALLFLSLPLYFLTPIFFRKVALRKVGKIYAEGENKSLLGEHVLRIEPDGLTEKTELCETKQRWESLEKIVTDGPRTSIFAGAVQAYIIPRQSVLAGDYEAFVAELRRRYQEAAGNP